MNALKVVAFLVLGFLAFAGVLAALVLVVGLLSAIGPFIFLGALAYFLVVAFVSKPKKMPGKKLKSADIDGELLAKMRVRFPGKFEHLGDFYRLKRDFETYAILKEEQRKLSGLDEDIERARFGLLLESNDYSYSKLLESVKERLSSRPESIKEAEREIEIKMLGICCAYSPEVWDCFEYLMTELEVPKIRSESL